MYETVTSPAAPVLPDNVLYYVSSLMAVLARLYQLCVLVSTSRPLWAS